MLINEIVTDFVNFNNNFKLIILNIIFNNFRMLSNIEITIYVPSLQKSELKRRYMLNTKHTVSLQTILSYRPWLVFRIIYIKILDRSGLGTRWVQWNQNKRRYSRLLLVTSLKSSWLQLLTKINLSAWRIFSFY